MAKKHPLVICAKCGKKKARKIMTPTPLNKLLQTISVIGLFGAIIMTMVFDAVYIIDFLFFPIFITAMIIGMIPAMLDYKRGKFTFKCNSCKQTYEMSIKGRGQVGGSEEAHIETHSEISSPVFDSPISNEPKSDIPTPNEDASKLIWIIITIIIFGSMASYFTYQFLAPYFLD